jgi:hypothetical protein
VSEPATHLHALHFQVLDYVTVTMLGVRYKGRVNRIFVESDRPKDNLYEVQLAKDNGDLTMLTFRHDEIELTRESKGVGFVGD